MKHIGSNVRSLRKSMTDAEQHLWYHLRAKGLKGYKFRRQHLIYPYIVDFVCLSKKLIVECDGSQHLEQENYDEKRTHFLEAQGYKVIRFWNDMILQETTLVLEVIYDALEEPSQPSSLPSI